MKVGTMMNQGAEQWGACVCMAPMLVSALATVPMGALLGNIYHFTTFRSNAAFNAGFLNRSLEQQAQQNFRNFFGGHGLEQLVMAI